MLAERNGETSNGRIENLMKVSIQPLQLLINPFIAKSYTKHIIFAREFSTDAGDPTVDLMNHNKHQNVYNDIDGLFLRLTTTPFIFFIFLRLNFIMI